MNPPRKVRRKKGHVWEVRYREGGRHRSRVFDRKADAEDFQADVRRRKQLGTLTQLHAGDQLLADFGLEWWRLHARPNLQESTLRRYSYMWDRHVLPHVGRSTRSRGDSVTGQRVARAERAKRRSARSWSLPACTARRPVRFWATS